MRIEQFVSGAAVDRLGDAILLVDPGGSILDANAAALSLYGYSHAEMLSLGVGDIRAPQQPDAAEGPVRDAAENDGTLFEAVARRSDGALLPVEVRSILVSLDGETAWLSVVRDITERKRAEQAQARAQEFSRVTFEHADVGMAHVGTDGAWLRVNERLCDLLGYSREELFRLTFADVTHPDDVEENIRHLRSLVVGDEETYHAEKRYFRKDGALVWVNLSVALVRDRDGAPDYFVSVLTDITARKRAEEALLGSRAFIASILDTSPNLIYIYDLVENRNVYSNREVSQFLGYTPEQILAFGSSLFERILHPEDAERVSAHHARMAEASDSATIDVGYRMKDSSGEWRWLQSRDVPFARDEQGRVTQILGFTEDITERKHAEDEILRLNTGLEERVQERTEELQAKNRQLNEMNTKLEDATRAKSDFLAAMSHELRTPLNSIIGFSGIMLQGLAGDLTPEQSKQLGMINNSGRHLLGLINEVLDLAKVESGQNRPVICEVDVGTMAREMFRTVMPMAEGKGIEMRWACPEDLRPVLTDMLRLDQILLNLLGNAVKFTEHGHVGATVSQDDSGVTISVEDSGCGIAAEDLERIFDDFYQVARHSSARSGGAGLGLAVSRRLAESIGARIEVASEPGRGSVFTLSIPERPPTA